jgi:hypothetical protein
MAHQSCVDLSNGSDELDADAADLAQLESELLQVSATTCM